MDGKIWYCNTDLDLKSADDLTRLAANLLPWALTWTRIVTVGASVRLTLYPEREQNKCAPVKSSRTSFGWF